MKPLLINEIFYSLQGEGRRAGEPSIFVRLAGCDLACGFCDTEFTSGKTLDPQELHALLLKHPARWIVWTGGEPCLQLTSGHVHYFKGLGYKQAIETNGNHRPPDGLDWTCVSPKVAEHVLIKNFPTGVNELRYVRHAGQLAAPEPSVTADHYFLSPMFKGNQPDRANIEHCTRLCLENPRWSLSLQTHKLLNIL